jgi:hypothetical protein
MNGRIASMGRVHPDEDALVGVVGDQRRRLLLVDLQAMPDGPLLVVVTLEQRAPARVAFVVLLVVELHVPDAAALAAGAPAGQPPDHLVVVDDELEHEVERLAPVLEHVAQDLGLRDVPREAVEQETVLRVVLREAVADHGDGDLVGHQVTTVHVRLGQLAKVRAARDVGTEYVTCRDLRDGQVRCDVLGLRPLTRSGGPDQNETHYRRKPS